MSTQDCSARGKYCVFGKSTEESAANSADWIREETEELVSEEDIETAGGGGGGQNDGDCDSRGIGGKRREKRKIGRSGRQGQHLGGHLQGNWRSRSRRPQ